MSDKKKQRTRIEDLPDDGNELFDLSEEVLMMVSVFGGSGGSGVDNPLGGSLRFEPYETYIDANDVRTDYEVVWDT